MDNELDASMTSSVSAKTDTPETEKLLARHIAESAAAGLSLANIPSWPNSLGNLPYQQVKELLEHARSLEHRLREAEAKLDESDGALRIRATECLMQSQRAERAERAEAALAEAQKDAADLKHDIERHVSICSEQAARIAELEKAAALLYPCAQALVSTGASWVVNHELLKAISAALERGAKG